MSQHNHNVHNNHIVAIQLEDIVRLRKKHPCGSFHWRITRVGVDVGLKCCGCGHQILMPRGKFNKQLKKIEPDHSCAH